MKIDYSSYQLVSVGGALKEGALLRVIESDGVAGYADLHPWIEFGDAPLSEQLKNLKEEKPTLLVKQSLWMAARDTKARKEKRSLLAGNFLPNNFLITDIQKTLDLKSLKKQGFSILKIKVGFDIDREINFIKNIGPDFLLRLDFNSKSSFDGLKKFLERLSQNEKNLIQYIEDPFSYDQKEWEDARNFAALALDFESEKLDWNPLQRPACDVVILKPSRRDVSKAVECFRSWRTSFTVTSALDHPVGVIHALSVANDLQRELSGQMLAPGCLTLSCYQPEEFSSSLEIDGPFIGSQGYGVGFDSLLEKQSWQPL
jgi:hypothetical protein